MTFIDFCAGIGGGRLGLTNNNFTPIGFSEIEPQAVKTYRLLFNTDEENLGDLTKIQPFSLPDFDLLIGGFPCQTFSIIGDRCGLEDKERGQIIYYLAEILRSKQVKYFILENVKGLINHDKGRTLRIVLELLDGAGYNVSYEVLNSENFSIPHMRERVYLVGTRKDLNLEINFNFYKEENSEERIKEFLIDEREEFIFDEGSKTFPTFQKYLNNKYNKGKYDLENILKQDFLVLDTRQSDLRLYGNRVPTIRKGRQGILYVKNGKLRKLSGFEALLLQGFSYEKAMEVRDKISNSQLLGLAGNAMTVNVVDKICKRLLEEIENHKVKCA